MKLKAWPNGLGWSYGHYDIVKDISGFHVCLKPDYAMEATAYGFHPTDYRQAMLLCSKANNQQAISKQ